MTRVVLLATLLVGCKGKGDTDDPEPFTCDGSATLLLDLAVTNEPDAILELETTVSACGESVWEGTYTGETVTLQVPATEISVSAQGRWYLPPEAGDTAASCVADDCLGSLSTVVENAEIRAFSVPVNCGVCF